MKYLLVGIAILPLIVSVAAQAPPSFHRDAEHGTMRYVQNLGQVFDTNGDPRPEIKYYAAGSPLGIFLQEKSVVSLTTGTFLADTNLVDTVYRIDMAFHHGYERSPVLLMITDELRHYYYGDALAVENVPAAHRILYQEVWNHIDVHFLHGGAGPRMSFLIQPGGDPSDIGLRFTGQDSIAVDLLGRLKLYADNKMIDLPPALAYQYDAENNISQLYWIPSYVNEQGSVLVKFDFLGYDPELPLVFEVGLPPMSGQGAGGTSGNLSWSTSVGRDGYGSTPRDHIFSADKLPDHDLLVTGSTSDSQFPAVTGAIPEVFGHDVFVSRFAYAPEDDDNDARLIWTTFIGSGPEPGNHEQPAAIKYVPTHGKIYVAGWTGGDDWPMEPTSNPGDGSFYQHTMHGTTDGFILRLSTLGELERSSYYGGAGSEVITTITHDESNGNVYFFGSTSSSTGEYNGCAATSTHLPLCDPGSGSYQQNTNAGGIDMFVARFDANFRLTWGTFIGSEGDDRVFDSDAYVDGTDALLAICGSTNKQLPFLTGGDFQLNANSGPYGFVWLFKGTGATDWGTQIHGTTDLQAVSFGKDRLRVMGTSEVFTNVNIQSSCAAISGVLSICGGDDELIIIDHYLADFNAITKALTWSTLIGGFTDAGMAEAIERYEMFVPFGINRYMDLESNAQNSILAMGTFSKPAEVGTWFNTMEGFGMYNQPYYEPMGWDQSEVYLSLYDGSHNEVWTTTFGSHFDHINSDPPGFDDWDMLHHGCDYGHGLVWVDGEVLYLVGTTGGQNLFRECPFPPPEPSYCELAAPPFDGWIDGVDGLIVRFDMRDVEVGLPETVDAINGMLTAHPSPTSGMLSVTLHSANEQPITLRVIDATGRTVLLHPNWRTGSIDVSALASGAYSVLATNGTTGATYHARFVKD